MSEKSLIIFKGHQEYFKINLEELMTHFNDDINYFRKGKKKRYFSFSYLHIKMVVNGLCN